VAKHRKGTQPQRSATTSAATISASSVGDASASSVGDATISGSSVGDTTPYDGAATINSAGIIAAASTILVVRIAVAAVVATAYNCPPSNDRSTSIHCGSAICTATIGTAAVGDSAAIGTASVRDSAATVAAPSASAAAPKRQGVSGNRRNAERECGNNANDGSV
jgi:hypothetical protein